MLRFLILSGFLFVFLFFSSFSQSTENKPDKNSVSGEIAGLTKLYDSLFQHDLDVIDGRAHTAKYPSGIGHPFFLTREPVMGEIYIKGQEFRHSFMRYDLLNDMLQIYHFTKSGPQIIDLNKNKIEAFTIEGHHFINLTVSETTGMSSLEGFYEEKYKGATSYLVRHEKVYLENISGSRGGYEDHSYRYLSDPGGWFKITGQRSLLKAFEKNHDEIKEFIRKSQMTIKLATDEEIIRVIKFNESINRSH
jgi:hypothetical protein